MTAVFTYSIIFVAVFTYSIIFVIVTVCIPRLRFLLHVFFFLPAFVDFGWQILLLWTVYALFTYCAYTVYVLKNIKNETHDTIYTFKYYFATVFSVFSFQFIICLGEKISNAYLKIFKLMWKIERRK